jgi:hypothetical protein
MTTTKKILKKIRPVYDFAKRHPFLANLMFSMLETYNRSISWRYSQIPFITTDHINCDDQPIASSLNDISSVSSSTPMIDLVTVAFNNASLIEAQIAAVKQNVRDGRAVLTIADNSSKSEIAKKIREICARTGTAYIRLPDNPRSQANLSHSIALNWIYENYVKPRRPEIFGFLDHDIFPIRPTSIAEKFGSGSGSSDPATETLMYGHFQERPYGNSKIWYLWAGFCFYKLSYLADKKVNFSSIVFSSAKCYAELDTGGGNWPGVYSVTDRRRVAIATAGSKDGIGLIDEWAHVEKASFKTSEEIATQLSNILII